MTHTLEQLQEMSDNDLTALAATLRGWKLGGLLGKEEIDVWCTGERPPNDSYELQIRVAEWEPTADYNQAIALLQWAGQVRQCYFELSIAHDGMSIDAWSPDRFVAEVPDMTARSMVIAFVLAVQEYQ